MNQTLLIQRKQRIVQLLQNDYEQNYLNHFLTEEAENFHQPQSLAALSAIRNYCQVKKQEQEFLDQQLIEIEEKIKCCCDHEILVKNEYQTNCLICHTLLLPPEIPQQSIILQSAKDGYFRFFIKAMMHDYLNQEESLSDFLDHYFQINQDVKKYLYRKENR